MAETGLPRPVPVPEPLARAGAGAVRSRHPAPGRARRALRRLAAGAGLLAAVLAALALAAGFWVRHRLEADLPRTSGRLPVAGLSAPATIERDALGVPTVRGANRADVARATGFAHAQDRFFQMDLLRRRSAGELAELVGPAAVSLDRATRIHGFRALARQVIARTPPETRAVFEAYADGVNAGL